MCDLTWGKQNTIINAGVNRKKVINEDKDLKYLFLLLIIVVVILQFTYTFSKLQISSTNNFVYVNSSIAPFWLALCNPFFLC